MQPVARALCQHENCRSKNDDRPNRQAMHSSPLCDLCEERAWQNLQQVAKLWPSTVHGLTHHGPGTGEKVDGTPTYGLDLDDKALELRGKVTSSLRFWTRLLLDENRITRAPNSDDIPAMARTIGKHIAYLTHHHDEGIAVSVVVDARDTAWACKRLSAPQPSRTYKPGIPCVEHATDDQGNRVPCQGEYSAKLGEHMTGLPDLACTEDPDHILTPAGFRKLGKRYQPTGALRLLEAINGVA